MDFDVKISHPELLPNLARTMHLLATSKAREAPEVRVLVYGQSISKQVWWLKVKQHLRNTFPHARLVMENWAIGGFHSTRLLQCAAHDVRLFVPDLVLFHDYGPQDDYEAIIRALRATTTAEIAVQTDHVAANQDEAWHDHHSEVWLPELCRRYDLALIDVRANWKRYLAQERIAPPTLLRDHVHLNDEGNALMADIVLAHLTAPTGTEPDPQALMTTLLPGKDFTVEDSALSVTFEGSRVDLVTDRTLDLEVWLDGVRPSTLAGSYLAERPWLDKSWPVKVGVPVRIDLGAPRDGTPGDWVERWTLCTVAARDNGAEVDFELYGSGGAGAGRARFDGEGSSTADFVSDSGRIVIPRDAWFVRATPEFFAMLPAVTRGDEITFAVRCLSRDRITPRDGPVSPVTLVHLPARGAHTLTLRAPVAGALEGVALRVYRPPLGPGGGKEFVQVGDSKGCVK